MSVDDKDINNKTRNIIEAAMFAAEKPLSIEQMLALFADDEKPERTEIKDILAVLTDEYAERGIELKQVSSGYRFQVKQDYSPWVSRLWEEKPPRYTKALLETLALIAYRQPITRAEIEDVRGVAVSTNIMKTLQERGWVKVVGHRDVPGRPSLFATTKEFLDYFNLKSMDELPTLAEIKSLDDIKVESGGEFSEEEIQEVEEHVAAVEAGPQEDLHEEDIDDDIDDDDDDEDEDDQVSFSADDDDTDADDIADEKYAASSELQEEQSEDEAPFTASDDNLENNTLDSISKTAAADETVPEGTLLN